MIVLSQLNRTRKKVADAVVCVGLGICMVFVLVVMIATPILWALDGTWMLLGHQSSNSKVWLDWANYELTHGSLMPYVFIPFGIGCLLFFLGAIIGIGRRVS